MPRLLRRLLRRLRPANRPRPPARRPRPSVEALEDRLTPTVFFQPQLGAESPAPSAGGPTLSNTPVYLIFEGYDGTHFNNYWQSPTGITKADVIQSVQNVLGSAYLSKATQYGANGHAYLAGAYDDFSLAFFGGSFAEPALQAVAARHVAERYNAPNARGLYFVVTPPGVTDGTQPTAGGYHSELSYNAPLAFFNIPEEVPYGWVGIGTGTRQAEVDHFSNVFSHELVEASTDPYPATQNANQFYHGTYYRATEASDEIADFEPDGGKYTYRLGNGTLVQAYWSQKDQAFVVPDGTTQTFTLTPHWLIYPGTRFTPPRTVFTYTFDLTVNGDQFAGKDDRFTVETIASGPQAGGVRVTLNGEAVALEPNQLRNLVLNTGAGNDAVDVESLPAGVTLTVNLGAGHDSVTLGQVAGQLDGLAGAVNINGGGADSTLTVNDAGTADFRTALTSDTHDVRWVATGSGLTRYDTVQQQVFFTTTTQFYPSNITYSGLGKIDLFGGHCTDFYYLGTDDLSTPLTVWGTGAGNTLVFNDGGNADNLGTRYDLTAGRVTRVGTDLVDFFGFPLLLQRTATVNYYNVPTVNVVGGASGNEVNVASVGADTELFLNPGDGVNTVTVGSAAESLDDVHGALYVDGFGTNTLVLNDTAVQNTDSFVNSVAFTVNDSEVVRTNTVTVNPGDGAFSFTNTATITYAGVTGLVIKGGSTGNTFTVQATAANTPTTIEAGAGDDVVNVLGTNASGPLTVDGAGGNDLVRVGSAAAFAGDTGAEGGTLANVQGAVSVLNSAGSVTLVLDDSGDPAAYDGVNVASGSLTGLGGAAAVNWSGASTLLYLGGTAGQAGNTVSVDASVSGGLPEIFTGPGDEVVNVLNPSADNTLVVHGLGGNDTLNVIDADTADASYGFDGATLTRVGYDADGNVTGTLTVLTDGFANVQVNGASF